MDEGQIIAHQVKGARDENSNEEWIERWVRRGETHGALQDLFADYRCVSGRCFKIQLSKASRLSL